MTTEPIELGVKATCDETDRCIVFRIEKKE